MKEHQVLVLQGGGALGAYQAGAYCALHEAGIEPDWLAGISIGAINSAIIAGNAKQDRPHKLREFWDLVSSNLVLPELFKSKMGRSIQNGMSANAIAAFGAPGFFRPNNPVSTFINYMNGSPASLGVYDTSPLRDTLMDLIDFDRLNHPESRVSLGAVNVSNGNFVYFDSDNTSLAPEHIMASGALPEGFPPIAIDGELYWDGGLVSNTPLQYVIDQNQPEDLCIFQVDLFSARGSQPENMMDVQSRMMDIRYSSRTRLNTDIFRKNQQVKCLVNDLLKRLPESLLDESERALLERWSQHNSISIAHLIYRAKDYEQASKDYEFSRLSVHEHWDCGYKDAQHLLAQKSWRERTREKGIQVFDFKRSEKIEEKVN